MPQSQKLKLPKGTIIPDHIAIVLDGNGRWARSRGLPPTKGHEEGAKAMRRLVDAARDTGVHTLTLWAFSTENWKRPPKEVHKILSLVKKYIKEELVIAKRDGVRFYHLGKKDRLPTDLMRWIKKAEKETQNNSKFILNLALDYGGRDEIIRAIQKIVEEKVPASRIDEKLVSSYMDTAGQPYPNPDLFIRTSGEQRTSGMMPWQLVYSEYYFEQDHLPDMDAQKLKTAILDYSRRRRRFGAKDKVTHFKFNPEVVARFELNWWRLQNIPQGTKLRDYSISHIKEQFGLSKELAIEAAKYMIEAVYEGKKKKWNKSLFYMKKFYELIHEEIKLAFEPSLAASLQIKFWRSMGDKKNYEETFGAEEAAKHLYSEVYRISAFQATKIAHLFVLANVERNLAESGYGEKHWVKAEDYLEKFYKALKERVA